MTLKAYHVFEQVEGLIYSSLLVFAHDRNKARSIAFYSGLWEYEYYIDVRAKRRPEYDKYASYGTSWGIVDTNADLPEGAPDFYDDEAI